MKKLIYLSLLVLAIGGLSTFAFNGIKDEVVLYDEIEIAAEETEASALLDEVSDETFEEEH
jgi:Na+-transporting methylmalonyl-CoA/oxaloacetate decarboxylase gamma subunit